jgi:anti-anti-sigma factor
MSQNIAQVETEHHDGQLVVSVSGEIDLSNARPVQEQIERAAAGSSDVVIDLSAVEYIDSQGLRLVGQLVRKFDREGSKLQLVAPPGSFARGILDLTLISKDVAIIDTIPGVGDPKAGTV